MPSSVDVPEGRDILVIEPEEETRRVLQGILQNQQIKWVGTAAEGREFLRREDCQLVICADELPDLPGLMLFAETRDLRPATQRILMCRDLDAEFLLHALREGSVLHYLPKPLDPEAAARLIDYALDQNRLMQNLLATRSLLDRAETRIANMETSDLATTRVSRGSFRALALPVFWILLVFALVFVGLSALYLIKSALGIDLFPDSHLQDFLTP
ncbi:MAG: response regulator [Terrimicrobiaceae bacterium]